MNHLLQFAYPLLLYGAVGLVCLAALLRYWFVKGVRYPYPLTSLIAARHGATTHWHKRIKTIMRVVTLLLMALLVGKPQLVDSRSHITVHGIDIMLVLDVSGSMGNPHYDHDNRTRIQVAKQEAIRFIDKRTNDAIGLVIFAEDTLSRCPLTADTVVLKQLIDELEIGVIPYKGTVLAKAMVTAANRLKQSTAKSKIMILLTDGEPSEQDIDPNKAIAVAKQLGIKIYTIGIGDDETVMVQHPLFGPIGVRPALNKPLLTTIAHETGGTFFQAKNAQDMRAIYDTINRLEKTNIETPLFTNVIDWFMPLVWTVFILLLLELLLTLLWFAV